MKMLVFFLAKCVRNAVKTMVVHRKNQKALALLYLASKPLRKAANSSGVPTEFEQNRRGKFELFAWTLSPNFFRLDWTFPLPPKRQLSVLLNFFFPLTNLFLTFVVFACFATTRVNMRFRAENTRDSAQDSIQCRKWLVCLWCGRTDGRTDVRTDGHVTTTSLPKFFGLIDYQISLAMELRWRASALAPLIYWCEHNQMSTIRNSKVVLVLNLVLVVQSEGR